jgi:2-amino-1-hydroxyethylphosphonate dioxygenase (glycine-forming)
MKKNFLFLFFSLMLSTFSTAPKDLHKKITHSLISILKKSATTDYIGEEISQLEHALQAAYHANLISSTGQELIIAALFHDIANQTKDLFKLDGNEFGVFDHGPHGATFLKKLGFSEKVCTLVKEHATAKRYLVRNKKYYDKLSYASQQTLIQQGGSMTSKEAQNFEKCKYFKDMVNIRYCDDKAKDPNLTVPDIEYYRSTIEEHLKKQFEKNPTLILNVTNYFNSLH